MNAIGQNIRELPLHVIELDQRLQPRARIDEPTWRDYTEALNEGARFPPVTVFYDGATFLLADGFHRWHAHRACEVDKITAEIHPGGWQDALCYALGANAIHGRRREAADYRQAYARACEHNLMSASDAETVAALLNCSVRWAYDLTAKAREDRERKRDAAIEAKKAEGKSNRTISKETGIPRATVNRMGGSELNTAKVSHLPQRPKHPAEVEFEDLTSVRGERWGSAYDALLAIGKLPSVDAMFTDRYTRLDEAFAPALQHAHAWIAEFHRRFFAS